jgi:hypothetical protein
MSRKTTGAATHHSKADTDRHIHGALWGAKGRAEILDDHSTLVLMVLKSPFGSRTFFLSR